MTSPTIHLRPTAPLAERVLLPGDPGRALLLAQALTEKPRMFNHDRGLWGYTGTATDGEPLTIQSTGMGGPSAAIVIEELVRLGARRLVRVGTCGGLAAELALGDVIVAREAFAADGASRALGAGERVAATAALSEALAAAAGEEGVRAGPIVTTDLFYDPDGDFEARWAAAGALAVEMEAATLFALADRHGVDAGCVLAVSDLIGRQRRERGGAGERERIGTDALEGAGVRIGRIAAAALGAG